MTQIIKRHIIDTGNLKSILLTSHLIKSYPKSLLRIPLTYFLLPIWKAAVFSFHDVVPRTATLPRMEGRQFAFYRRKRSTNVEYHFDETMKW